MLRLLPVLFFVTLIPSGGAATFGSVTTVIGSAGDIVLDEARRRLYLVNTNANRVEAYSLAAGPSRQVNSVPTDSLPLAAALSTDKKFLYVVCHNSASLNIIDLDRFGVTARPSLPARPEGIAVGNDGRALITTIGTGPNNAQNTLLIYDPNDNGTIANVVFTPSAPSLPPGAPPAGRAFLANRSRLAATAGGGYIIGVNIPNNTTRAVFVYEVASGVVLRSRIVNNVSSVLAVSPDGSRFMSGLTLFDTQTLEVLAQQNLANAPYPIQPGTNFNTQQNQGGSVFSPDGSILYSAFNVAPVANPPARPNVAQLMVNDPDNLLIEAAFQMPENLAGKMIISSDGGTIYAISESGFTTIPIGSAANNPILSLPTSAVLVANDQCGVTSGERTAHIQMSNAGRGRLTANAQVLQLNPTGPGGLGGVGGPGGGLPGGGVIIVIPPTVPGGGTAPTGPQLPAGGAGGQNNAIFQTAPQVRVQQSSAGPSMDITYNSVNNRTLGTVSPVHDFLIQSPEAINIPPRLRVLQNNRDAESRANVVTVPVGISANEGLEDILYDAARNRVYIANSGMNRIEVFDAASITFLDPIKAGQLPRSMALSQDNATLYVANSGGENVSIIDLDAGQVVDRVHFPPLPFNATAALVTPSQIVSTGRGPLIIMNNGSIWKVIGNEAIPRAVSPVIGSATVPAPRTLAATPNGEYAMLLAGNGFVYLYDAGTDEFVQGRQVFTPPIQGYFGPAGAGPGGRYFLVNGSVLNAALTPTGSAGSFATPGRGNTVTMIPRPVSAVAPLGPTSFVRFTQPVRLQANNPITNDAPLIEVADANTGNTMRSVPTIEGPISTVTGTARANVSGRLLAADPSGSTAYFLTTSGLSIVALDAITPADRPQVAPNGIVNIANLKPSIAPGSLISIFGRNLAGEGSASNDSTLPTVMGGVCVTINNRPMPLTMTSAGQINALVPNDLAAGRYPVVVRSLERKAAALAPTQVTLSRYAPAVLMDPQSKQAAIYHSDGRPVTRDNPTTRDQRLVMYAIGLGPTKGGSVRVGEPAPSSPPAVTGPVSVFFGDPRYREAAIAVEWSGLAPGLVGIYEIDLYVPGDHLRGDALDVTIRAGGVSSSTKGELDPTIAVN